MRFVLVAILSSTGLPRALPPRYGGGAVVAIRAHRRDLAGVRAVPHLVDRGRGVVIGGDRLAQVGVPRGVVGLVLRERGSLLIAELVVDDLLAGLRAFQVRLLVSVVLLRGFRALRVRRRRAVTGGVAVPAPAPAAAARRTLRTLRGTSRPWSPRSAAAPPASGTVCVPGV